MQNDRDKQYHSLKRFSIFVQQHPGRAVARAAATDRHVVRACPWLQGAVSADGAVEGREGRGRNGLKPLREYSSLGVLRKAVREALRDYVNLERKGRGLKPTQMVITHSNILAKMPAGCNMVCSVLSASRLPNAGHLQHACSICALTVCILHSSVATCAMKCSVSFGVV